MKCHKCKKPPIIMLDELMCCVKCYLKLTKDNNESQKKLQSED